MESDIMKSVGETNLLIKAYGFAQEKHKGQRRKWVEEEYIEHPLRVCNRLFALGHSENVVAAGLLHDTIEDCDGVNWVMLAHHFNVEIADLVQSVTNPSTLPKYKHLLRAERKRIDREHILTRGYNAHVIKCLDRIDNLSQLRNAPKDFQRLYAGESLLLVECLFEADKFLRDELEYIAQSYF